MAEATFSLKGLIGLPEAEECLAPAIGRRRRYGPDPGSRRKSTPATPGASFRESRYPRVSRTKKENVRRRSLFLCIDAAGRQRGLSPKPVSAVPCPLPATRARPPRACPASPDGDRQPAIGPPSLPPLPSSPVKRVGRGWGSGGRGKPLRASQGVSLPPANTRTTAIYTLKNRSRSALLTTEKEDRAMAVPAIMGESMGPPKTCSRPAATGRPSRL